MMRVKFVTAGTDDRLGQRGWRWWRGGALSGRAALAARARRSAVCYRERAYEHIGHGRDEKGDFLIYRETGRVRPASHKSQYVNYV